MSENDVLPYATFIAIATMAAMTYLVRVGGFWMMGHVPITARVHRMLEALPGAVVAAIILPVVAKNGLPALLAVLAVIAVMMIRRNDFIAIGVGLAVAALARLAGVIRRRLEAPSIASAARKERRGSHSSMLGCRKIWRHLDGSAAIEGAARGISGVIRLGGDRRVMACDDAGRAH